MNLKTNLLDALKVCLEATISPDAMNQRLLELANSGTLQSLFYDSLDRSNRTIHLATFIISMRQVDGTGRNIAEHLLYNIFHSVKKAERATFFKDLATEIANRTNSTSKVENAILFLKHHPSSLANEEMMIIGSSPEFKAVDQFLLRLTNYKDFKLSPVEVLQVFSCLDELAERLNSRSDAFMRLYNDFLARSALERGFEFEAE